MANQSIPETVDEHITRFSPDIQEILKKIRQTVKFAAPLAQETIRYRMPTFKQNGVLIHFAAFRRHIGIYPPVRGDDSLMRAVKPYAGPKGNLQFPLNEAIPIDLIRRIVTVRVLARSEKPESKGRPRKSPDIGLD